MTNYSYYLVVVIDIAINEGLIITNSAATASLDAYLKSTHMLFSYLYFTFITLKIIKVNLYMYNLNSIIIFEIAYLN